MKNKGKLAALATVATTGLVANDFVTYCVSDANTQAKTVMKALFNVLTFSGVILLVVGVVSIIQNLVSGDQAPPGALKKAIGMLVAGAILVASKWVVTQIIGQDPTTLSIF